MGDLRRRMGVDHQTRFWESGQEEVQSACGYVVSGPNNYCETSEGLPACLRLSSHCGTLCRAGRGGSGTREGSAGTGNTGSSRWVEMQRLFSHLYTLYVTILSYNTIVYDVTHCYCRNRPFGIVMRRTLWDPVSARWGNCGARGVVGEQMAGVRRDIEMNE